MRRLSISRTTQSHSRSGDEASVDTNGNARRASVSTRASTNGNPGNSAWTTTTTTCSP